MDQPLLRLLIQEKLADRRLPAAAIPRVVDGPGTGETCDGCGETITNSHAATQNGDGAGGGLPFHVASFHVWDVERQVFKRKPSVRLPARSALRAPGARPGRPWSTTAPAARPTSPASS
jgi:hypothetical protein